jgi:hypothetical protein
MEGAYFRLLIAYMIHQHLASMGVLLRAGSLRKSIARLHAVCRDLPIKQCQNNPSTVLAVTVRGGHCAHLKGLWPFGHSYLDEMIVRFLGAVLEDAQT